MLITLYGINNIGKSTHAKRLVERLKAEGHDAVYVKYPVYDVEPTGTYLNAFLRSGSAQEISEEELQMWFILNRYQFEPKLREWLKFGRIVVAEDYIGTGIAWGTVKGADSEWLESMNKNLIQEDLAILIDGERAMDAVEEGHLHETNLDFMKRSRQVHLELGEKYEWVKVPLQDEKDDTAALIWSVVQGKLGTYVNPVKRS
ncbi:hypothetical protein HOD30_00320 [Candidatus Peregrinibacteria bacterium]|jgi:thymidylate kinase|nr:hypothetical protein [Candidatus Peregrinibacteria bacterium]MBT4631341.1 hypothetical protein [Candidatus Peregrinibacteria bacterium]MBT5516720.1 hypothetical protein [Candidatus Peregrinibacteria bacterium]MBT5823784.1 hypothetical protein [Candidatus Peregrinibacteria bacterium]